MMALVFSWQQYCHSVSDGTSCHSRRMGGGPGGGGSSHLSEEPRDQVAEDDGLVGFVVIWWGWNAGNVPQVRLPLVHELVGRLGVDQKYPWGALNEPTTIEDADATIPHRRNGSCQLRTRRLQLLNLDRSLECPPLANRIHRACRERKLTD